MSDNNAMVSRQATPSNAPVAMQAQTDALMVRAKMIADQGDMLPERYRDNPGACLMAVDWAERNNVSIFDTLGHVAFVHGKPVVEARLQRKMARERGYSTRLIESTTEHATVAVHGADGKQIGEPVTYTWELAQEYGIHYKNKKTKVVKDQWNTPTKRQHMLVLRATTRALDYYGDGMFGDVDEDSYDADEEPQDAPAPINVAEHQPEHPEADQGAMQVPTEDDLKAALKAKGISQADALRAVAAMDYADLSTLARVADNADAALDLRDWIEQQ